MRAIVVAGRSRRGETKRQPGVKPPFVILPDELELVHPSGQLTTWRLNLGNLRFGDDLNNSKSAMPPTFSQGVVAGDREVSVGIDSYTQIMTKGAEYRHIFWCAVPSHL